MGINDRIQRNRCTVPNQQYNMHIRRDRVWLLADVVVWLRTDDDAAATTTSIETLTDIDWCQLMQSVTRESGR
jgi:hypothetical protein